MHCSMEAGSALALRRPSAAIVLGQNGPDQPAEAFGLFVVQIAGQAERMAAGIDELLQRVGALCGIAHDGDAGCHSFCLSGYLHDEEAERFGRLIRPILAEKNRGRWAA